MDQRLTQSSILIIISKIISLINLLQNANSIENRVGYNKPFLFPKRRNYIITLRIWKHVFCIILVHRERLPNFSLKTTNKNYISHSCLKFFFHRHKQKRKTARWIWNYNLWLLERHVKIWHLIQIFLYFYLKTMVGELMFNFL